MEHLSRQGARKRGQQTVMIEEGMVLEGCGDTYTNKSTSSNTTSEEAKRR